jgi:hypothetical protein
LKKHAAALARKPGPMEADLDYRITVPSER